MVVLAWSKDAEEMHAKQTVSADVRPSVPRATEGRV